MVNPQKTSKCPGCKVLKSAHDFGPPGKHCPGPDLIEDSHGSQATLAEQTEPAAANASDMDSNAVLIKSLVDSVQKLTMDVQSLRQKTQDLRKLAHIPPARDPPPSSSQARNAATDNVTLPELRAMTALASKVDRRVDQFGLLLSEDSDIDGEDAHSPNAGLPSASTSGHPSGKLKSGREAKPTSSVLYPQLWLQSFLCLTRTQREVNYEDLTMAEFVAGYAQILQSKDISAFEVSERHKHLVSLMYFAQQFTWSAVLNFHGAVLLEIERGLIKCGDSFMHLESRTLYGHPLPDKTAKFPV